MKTIELIKKLQKIVEVNPDSETIIFSATLDSFTTDIDVSCDDENIAIINEIGGSKPF